MADTRNLPILLFLGMAQGAFAADAGVHECVLVLAVDETFAYANDDDECSLPTSPASTFKLPHALIALDTGVITDPLANVPWDGTDYSNESWKRDHSMDSAIKWSAVWFFQHTAELIGRERMLEGLAALDYAADSYEGEQAEFWRNGDLVVTPYEQLNFLLRLANDELPVAPGHLDALNAAFLMPEGKVTMATGEHDFDIRWSELEGVHAKTGNTRVNGESVSWLIGYVDADVTRYVFVARARSDEPLPSTAGADLAETVLNAQAELIATAGETVDLNKDGIHDIWYEFEDGAIYELIDRNLDAKVDQSNRYEADYRLISSKLDADFDGYLETSIDYVNGYAVKSITDSDADELFDILSLSEFGELISSEKYYAARDGEPARIGRIEYSFGYPAGNEELRVADETAEEFSERALSTGK